MLASSVLITAGTPDSMYLEDRQEKWLRSKGKEGELARLEGGKCKEIEEVRRRGHGGRMRQVKQRREELRGRH